MSLLAQHGFGDGGRIRAGLEIGLIDGCILSPKDLSRSSMLAKIEEIRQAAPAARILFDPQFYVSLIGNLPGVRLGSLMSDYGDYFAPKHYKDLRREKNIRDEVEKVIQFQQRIGLQEIILPGILMQDGLKSEAASIAKSFLEIGDEVAGSEGIASRSWLTLALGESCFRDLKALQDLVDEITGMGLQSHGVYLLVETSNLDGISPWCHSSVLSGQMYLVYALSLAGFKVTCGYSGLSAPYLSSVGADAVAFGWFDTLRYFSLDRFRPSGGMSQRPKKKYLSRALWSRLDVALLRAIATAHPSVLNGSEQDEEFMTGEPKEKDEILQHWHAVREYCDEQVRSSSVPLRIANFRLHLTISEQLKARIPMLSIPGFDERITQTRGALSRFEHLAELSLPRED
jgi:hypothetical protein